MKAVLIVLLAYASTATGDTAEIAPPSPTDFDIARTSHVHEVTGVGGMAECHRFADFQCRRSSQDSAEFHCTYREWTKNDLWIRKTVALRKDGDDWRWLSGDTPEKCSIMLFN